MIGLVEVLAGKTAVVTGGASGIGYGLAERFAAEGMGVVVADVEAAALAEAGARLRDAGAEVLEVVTDVRDPAQVDGLAEQAVARFGAVHVVCNNAGVGAGGGDNLWEVALEDWEWVFGVNLFGVVHGLRAFVPRLVAQGEGHVVNTASMAGLTSGAALGPYQASKHAVVALSESLALNLTRVGSPVGVSVLCPGWVDTRLDEAERNRPTELAAAGDDADPAAERRRAAMREVLAVGMAPAEVAAKVVTAIRADQFYVLPHDSAEWLALIEGRFQNILARRRPTPTPPPGSEPLLRALAETRASV